MTYRLCTIHILRSPINANHPAMFLLTQRQSALNFSVCWRSLRETFASDGINLVLGLPALHNSHQFSTLESGVMGGQQDAQGLRMHAEIEYQNNPKHYRNVSTDAVPSIHEDDARLVLLSISKHLSNDSSRFPDVFVHDCGCDHLSMSRWWIKQVTYMCMCMCVSPIAISSTASTTCAIAMRLVTLRPPTSSTVLRLDEGRGHVVCHCTSQEGLAGARWPVQEHALGGFDAHPLEQLLSAGSWCIYLTWWRRLGMRYGS